MCVQKNNNAVFIGKDYSVAFDYARISNKNKKNLILACGDVSTCQAA
jgi:predicted nuclease of predicted toxin-antitoxin system